MKNIFCVGGATIDHKLIPINTLITGTSNLVKSHTTFGGVARNVAENLAHWTQNINLQCVVGDDIHGKNLLNHAQSLGINIDACLILANQHTAHYYAVLTEKGNLHVALADMNIYDNIFQSFLVAAWDKWQPHDIIFIDTNLPKDILKYVINFAAEKQLQLCVDPVSVMKANKLPISLHGIFLLKPNKLEAAALTNTSINSITDCIQAGKTLQQRGAENIVISLGEEGYVIVNAQHATHVSIQANKHMVDANGAGDAFVAGILYGLQQQKDLNYACELGATAAAMTIQSEKTVLDTITPDHLMRNNMKATYATIF